MGLLMHQPFSNQTLNEILIPHLRKFLFMFFDKILIYNWTWEEHLVHEDVFLALLQQQTFFTKKSKSEFGMWRILYVGHIINIAWVKMD